MTPEEIARAERIAGDYLAAEKSRWPIVNMARWFAPEIDLPYSKEQIRHALIVMGAMAKPTERDSWMSLYGALEDYLPLEEYRAAIEGQSLEETHRMRGRVSERFEARLIEFNARVDALRLDSRCREDET